MSKEVRSFINAGLLEARATADGKKRLEGYAIVFNSKSEDLGGFVEIIAPDALTRTLKENDSILHLRDHDSSKLLGNTKAGTTKLTVDSKGLKFVTVLPDTELAADTYENVRLRNLTGNSFGFNCVADKWAQVGNQLVRTVTDLDLFEISTTSFAAYSATSVDVRSVRATMSLRDDQLDGDLEDQGIEYCSNCPCARCNSMRSDGSSVKYGDDNYYCSQCRCTRCEQRDGLGGPDRIVVDGKFVFSNADRSSILLNLLSRR